MEQLEVSIENSAGVLDSVRANSPAEAVHVLIAMITETGELHDGDVFRIRAVND